MTDGVIQRVRVAFRRTGQLAVPLCLVFAGGCEQTRDIRDLDGEWRIQINAESVGTRKVENRTVTGILVFDPSLPIWAEKEQIGLESPLLAGRLFAPVQQLGENPQGTMPSTDYSPKGRVSLNEEVLASVTGAEVRFVLAPAVIGGRVEFSGLLQGDTVRGQWRMPPHPVGMYGNFVMWRAPNAAMLDSAKVWATRVAPDDERSATVQVDTNPQSREPGYP